MADAVAAKEEEMAKNYSAQRLKDEMKAQKDFDIAMDLQKRK